MTEEEKKVVAKAIRIIEWKCSKMHICIPTKETLLKSVDYWWNVSSFNE